MGDLISFRIGSFRREIFLSGFHSLSRLNAISQPTTSNMR
jgi:hypothetical protein